MNADNVLKKTMSMDNNMHFFYLVLLLTYSFWYISEHDHSILMCDYALPIAEFIAAKYSHLMLKKSNCANIAPCKIK